LGNHPGGSIQLSDMARGASFRGVHFKDVESAAEALKKKGLIAYDGNKVSKAASESIHDVAPDERVRMAEAYDLLVKGDSLSSEQRVDADKYKRLVIDAMSEGDDEDMDPDAKRGEWSLMIRKSRPTRWDYFLYNPQGGGSGSSSFQSQKAAFNAATRRVDWKGAKKLWVVIQHWDAESENYKTGKSYWWDIVESADDSFEADLVVEGAFTEDDGHHFFDGKNYFVDTAFLNRLHGVMTDMELKHMGFGEFYLVGTAGRIDFDRMRGKDFPGMSGRSHKVDDDKGGKLVKTMIAAMEKKKRSELVKESLDEGRTAEPFSVGDHVVFHAAKAGQAATSGPKSGERGVVTEIDPHARGGSLQQVVVRFEKSGRQWVAWRDLKLDAGKKESLDEGGLDPQGSGENKVGDTDVMPAKDGKFNVFQRKADGWKKVAGPFDSAEQARSAAAKVEKGKAESLGDALASGIGELDEAAKLKGKKLGAEINRLFKQHGNNIQFNIMDLGKIHKAGADAAEAGEDMEAAVVAAIKKYRVSESSGKKFSGWATNIKSGKRLPIHTVTARDEDDAVKQAKGIIAKASGDPAAFSYEMKPLRAVKEDVSLNASAKALPPEEESIDGDGANLTEATNGKVGTFLTILSSHLTQHDKKQIAGETKRGGRGNIHRLSLLLGALGKVRDDVKDVEGSDSSEAMEKLKWSLSKRFNDGFPPVTKLVKQIDAFVSSGKLPKITVQKSNEDIDLDEATEMAKPSFHAGSRVKFSPAAMRASMYREYHPKKGEMGTVVSNEYGRWPSDNPKKGSGAVKVKWDKAGLQTVHPQDAEVTGGKSAKAESSGFAGALGDALL